MDKAPEKPTIMVVDDTPANLKLLSQMLQDNGYRVVAFLAGAPALSAAARNPPDLILLDITMPEMNGFEVCKRLKADEKLKMIPVIFISALTETSEKVQAFSVGGLDYITKPFQFEEVQARVRTHLSLCAVRRELKRQNEILQENMRLRELVEQIIRHDLKGPLTAFINIPPMLQADENLTTDQIELLGILNQSASCMQEIINNSLDLYQMEQGKYKLRPVPVNVLKIITQISIEQSGLTASKNLKWSFILNGNPVNNQDALIIPGEAALFYSMLSNLIKNALEAAPEKSVVTVLASSAKPPTIEVKNLGVISLEIPGRFFEQFATSGKEKGTGLGTYSAKLMAKTLGGDISFTTSESEGTSLLVTLPPALEHISAKPSVISTASGQTSPAPEQAPSAPKPQRTDEEQAKKSLSDLRVLLVDDLSYMRQLIKQVLQEIGLTNILEAENGSKATALLREGVDLVISDLVMPEMSGLELFELMKSDPKLSEIPFILVTGEASPADTEEAANAGITHFISKPFSAERLRWKVQRILGL